jgi:hypothetical protein
MYTFEILLHMRFNNENAYFALVSNGRISEEIIIEIELIAIMTEEYEAMQTNETMAANALIALSRGLRMD